MDFELSSKSIILNKINTYMKPLFIVIFLVLLSPMCLFSQESDSEKKIKFSERIPAELEIEVNIKYTLSIGYADCFSGKVLNVLKGNLKDTSILLTVLAGDNSNLKVFTDAKESDILRLYFVFNKSGEPYSTTYITGFVDSDKNSWKLVGIEN